MFFILSLFTFLGRQEQNNFLGKVQGQRQETRALSATTTRLKRGGGRGRGIGDYRLKSVAIWASCFSSFSPLSLSVSPGKLTFSSVLLSLSLSFCFSTYNLSAPLHCKKKVITSVSGGETTTQLRWHENIGQGGKKERKITGLSRIKRQ